MGLCRTFVAMDISREKMKELNRLSSEVLFVLVNQVSGKCAIPCGRLFLYWQKMCEVEMDRLDVKQVFENAKFVWRRKHDKN